MLFMMTEEWCQAQTHQRCLLQHCQSCLEAPTPRVLRRWELEQWRKGTACSSEQWRNQHWFRAGEWICIQWWEIRLHRRNAVRGRSVIDSDCDWNRSYSRNSKLKSTLQNNTLVSPWKFISQKAGPRWPGGSNAWEIASSSSLAWPSSLVASEKKLHIINCPSSSLFEEKDVSFSILQGRRHRH